MRRRQLSLKKFPPPVPPTRSWNFPNFGCLRISGSYLEPPGTTANHVWSSGNIYAELDGIMWDPLQSFGTTQTGYGTTSVWCRGWSRYVEGCWGLPYLKTFLFVQTLISYICYCLLTFFYMFHISCLLLLLYIFVFCISLVSKLLTHGFQNNSTIWVLTLTKQFVETYFNAFLIYETFL